MASSHDFFLSGDHEAGRRLVAEALESEGYTVTGAPNNGLLAKRGSTKMTLFLGALAGKKFHVSFLVDFMVDDKGLLVARLSRNMTSGALKGGAIGAAKVNTAFREAADAIGAKLTAQQVLAGNISHD